MPAATPLHRRRRAAAAAICASCALIAAGCGGEGGAGGDHTATTATTASAPATTTAAAPTTPTPRAARIRYRAAVLRVVADVRSAAGAVQTSGGSLDGFVADVRKLSAAVGRARDRLTGLHPPARSRRANRAVIEGLDAYAAILRRLVPAVRARDRTSIERLGARARAENARLKAAVARALR